MSFLDFFKPAKLQSQRVGTWQELGAYRALFSAFGSDIFKSDTVRSCIRALSDHTSKANARCSVPRIERILNDSPNLYMNGKDFLAKIRTRLEVQNTAFVYIHRDDTGRPSGFYPVPYSYFEALDYNGRLYIKFHFNGSDREMVLPWADLAVLRKDYNNSDIAGDDNTAILPMLELMNTTNQGVANAVKATANLRGILKSTKAMLAPDAVKKQKDDFVRDYLNLENEGGIASLDATQEFTPITMTPTVTTWEQQREFRQNIYRYYGVNDHIIMSDYTESQMEAFYDAKIEPFLIALSVELTRKCFTEREIAFGAYIRYESNRIQYTSTATKLSMVALVDRGGMTPNEWRALFNLAPIDGGDVPIRRLDTAEVAPSDAPADDTTEEPSEQEGDENEE